jgi:DNA modification methylase
VEQFLKCTRVKLLRAIDEAVRLIPTRHELKFGDARSMVSLQPNSLHLVLTSPPYWTLKEYRVSDGQMGHIESYEEFLSELDKVWAHCFRALVPGWRLVCVVGDVCLSRRKNGGRHTVVPLHASIQEHCRAIGFDNLAPIIWHKISNAAYEAEGAGGFLGKPFEPNAVIKNDIGGQVSDRYTPFSITRRSRHPSKRHSVWSRHPALVQGSYLVSSNSSTIGSARTFAAIRVKPRIKPFG